MASLFIQTNEPEFGMKVKPTFIRTCLNRHGSSGFLKMPHRTFRPIPASKPHLMQPTLNPSLYQSASLSHTHSTNATLTS